MPVNAERKFLHDLASPITTIQLNLENVLCLLKDNKPEDIVDCMKMLHSCLEQSSRATELIKGRREILILGEPK